MIELYVYSTIMSPGNQGVFQLLKEVTFRRILASCSLRKWGYFWGALCAAQCASDWLGGALRKHLTELAVSASACHAGKYHNEEPQDNGQQADMFE
jgi:hypothetical protein